MTPPVMLLDVDGVLNAFQGGGWGPLRRSKVGFPIRWAPPLIQRLRDLHHDGTVEIRWSTTWCGFPAQLAQLEELFRFHCERAFTDRPMSKTWGDLKVEAALQVLGEYRRLIWADDQEAEAGRRLFPRIAAAEREGRALLVCPDSVLGLQPEQLDQIEEFAGVRDGWGIAA